METVNYYWDEEYELDDSEELEADLHEMQAEYLADLIDDIMIDL